MPKFNESDAMGRAGVHEVGLLISEMKWIFREQQVSDTGIDGQIEPCDENGNASGKLIGCQVKSGPSYFREETDSGFIYRGDSEHLAYWLSHSLPVIVILRNDESGNCYWQLINEKTVIRTEKGWKVEIPRAQVLGDAAKPALEQIAETGWLERTRTFTTPNKFFRRLEKSALFDYEQTLFGRSKNLEELHAFINDSDATVAILSGRGGIGKSKLIRHWSSEVADWTVLFKKETVPISSTTENEVTGHKCLLVVDDAHRHRDIDGLLQLVKDLKAEGKTIKVLLSCRPIGIQRIDAALSRSFDPSAVVRLAELKRLSEADARALAEEVLGPENAQLVPYLVSVSKDTPLVAVIGGRVLRRNPVLASELAGVEEFRRAVFDKFLDELEAVSSRDAMSLRPLLHVISALQPLALRGEDVTEALATFLGWKQFHVRQATDELEASGLLVRSGQMDRITPDMFADFLLEQASTSRDGTSNGYSDAVYEAFGSKYLPNLLHNLAELDFRTVEQGKSSLLTNIWDRIRARFQKAEDYEKVQLLEWIEPAAYHQPAVVLDLVRETMQEMDEEKETVEDGASKRSYAYSARSAANVLPRLLRAIAYHAACRDEAVRRLWKLARQDSREPMSYPEDALRVLKSVAAYSRYKPASFNLDVAKTIHAICSEPHVFVGERTPLDIVDELLKREAEEQESFGMKLVLTWFGLNYSTVGPVRKMCLQILAECLASEDIAKSCRAFRSLSALIHGFLPMHELSIEEAKWHSDERQECLSIVARRLAAGSLHLPLAREIKATLESFVARGKNQEANARAREVLAMLPKDINLEAFDAFCTADWDVRDPESAETHIPIAMERNRQRNRDAANEFRQQFATVNECIDQLANFFSLARQGNISPDGALEFINTLCEEPRFLGTLAEQIRNSTYRKELAITGQVVLRKLRERADSDYLTTALAAAKSDDLSLLRSAAAGMWGITCEPASADDLKILNHLMLREDQYVRETVVRTLWTIGKHPSRTQDAISRILAISPGQDKKLAGTICDAFLYDRISPQNLSATQVDELLSNLLSVPDLDEHGITMFLGWTSEHAPNALIRFLERRMTRLAEKRAAGDWSYGLLPRQQSAISLAGLRRLDLTEFRARTLETIESDKLGRLELIDLFWSTTALDENSFKLFRPSPPQTKPNSI